MDRAELLHRESDQIFGVSFLGDIGGLEEQIRVVELAEDLLAFFLALRGVTSL